MRPLDQAEATGLRVLAHTDAYGRASWDAPRWASWLDRMAAVRTQRRHVALSRAARAGGASAS